MQSSNLGAFLGRGKERKARGDCCLPCMIILGGSGAFRFWGFDGMIWFGSKRES